MLIPHIIEENLLSKEFFHIHTNLNNIFSWSELENLINLRPFMKVSRFKFFGDEKYYNWKTDCWLADTECPPMDIIKEIIENNFCLLYDCSRVNHKIYSICNELDKLLNCTSDAHIYFTLNSNYQGIGLHTDNVDVVVLQIDGLSKIYIENYGEFHLVPGDVIFIPKNHEHSITSLTRRLSISFPMKNFINSNKNNWINISE